MWKKKLPQLGIEPPTSPFPGKCANHYTTVTALGCHQLRLRHFSTASAVQGIVDNAVSGVMVSTLAREVRGLRFDSQLWQLFFPHSLHQPHSITTIFNEAVLLVAIV